MKKIKIKDIEYIFFDLDGTLLTSKRIISKLSLEIINKLKTLGINISIATGRPYYFIPDKIRILKPKLPVISCNSALVYDPTKNSIISINHIGKNQTKKIYEILVQNNGIFLIYTKDQIIMCKNEKINFQSKWFDTIKNINDNLDSNDQVNITFINTLEELNKFNINNYEVIKFLIIYSEMNIKDYQNIESQINKMDDVYIVRSQDEVFDIMPKGLTKGDGLQILHDKGIINLDKTLVFGDAENDLSMFKKAKWSVAMGNAQTKTKELATFVTDSNDEEGIYNFFINNVEM